MLDDFTPEQLKLASIFMPFAFEGRMRIIRDNMRFVHYTSAENAFKILKGKQVWLRDSRCMNDYMEVEHGVDKLVSVFRDDGLRETFYSALDQSIGRNVTESTIKTFDSWLPTLRKETFITSISEHDQDEDENGRLSMWRAYGKSTIGIALVINTAPFMSATDALQAYSSPVAYLTPQQYRQEFEQVSRTILEEKDFLSSLNPEVVAGTIFQMLIFGAVCLKHPGFREEREWRIIHIPSLWPSETLEHDVEVVGGTPQTVFKIPLINLPEKGLNGIEIPELIDRVIIGPSEYPGPIRDALVATLEALKVPNAADKVFISGIPLRV